MKISTHAPLAGRDPLDVDIGWGPWDFNPRAPCGARPIVRCPTLAGLVFQPTRPLRGATLCPQIQVAGRAISTHAPLAGRDETIGSDWERVIISTHAPLAGRDENTMRLSFRSSKISTHAPLAGRDSKSVQITMHIFAITDKFQMLLHRMPPVRAFCSFLMQENHADFGCEPPK